MRRNYQFTLQDTARQVRDSLVFQTYGDDWTLAFKGGEPAWVRLADGVPTSGRSGKYTVHYQLDQNTTTAERTAVLELKSRGVSTDIRIKQLGLKAEED